MMERLSADKGAGEKNPASRPASDRPLRLVLDLDAGIDDALALAYALGSPEVELVAVVASYGNVTQERAAHNARALLDLLGRPDVPVYAGADRPLGADASFSPAAGVVRIHGESGLGASELPAPSQPPCADGVGWLAREACAASPTAPLTYVPTGPLTNLALALRVCPELAARMSRVTFMGGALGVPGNVTPCAEANIHNDPEAADEVLASGLPTRMVGLDVTHQVVLTREETARWRALGTPAGRFFSDMTDHYIAIYEHNNPQLGGCALHDPLALATALDPTLVGCLRTNLRVCREGAVRGRTVCDPARLRDDEKNAEVALTVDAPRFLEEFCSRVRRALA